MDLQSHSEPELNIMATTQTASESAVYTGAFFPNATRFTISGGVFTCNVINNLPLEQLSAEFRRIILGDIKLGKELQNISGIVHRHSQSAGVRRMYSAEIHPDPAPVTIAIYQGHAAEEEWHQDLVKYEAIRHPNIMQLYGIVSTSRCHAMVFHHELIPYHQFLKRFQHSPILRTYFVGYCVCIIGCCRSPQYSCIPTPQATEFDEAINYLSLVFREPLTDYDDLPVLIRPTTGQVCLDLVRGLEKDLKHP
ncbi:hypothetical protein C8R45DRAFT_493369 [Mycena sanguinolenta]|nr:hypothetical protein C8R45DRAFT_493369 [Mycena sanguinolenta]